MSQLTITERFFFFRLTEDFTNAFGKVYKKGRIGNVFIYKYSFRILFGDGEDSAVVSTVLEQYCPYYEQLICFLQKNNVSYLVEVQEYRICLLCEQMPDTVFSTLKNQFPLIEFEGDLMYL